MNTSSWIVASFFHLFQQITKQLFSSKLWIYYMHINMLCYTTLPQQQNCFVNFESLTTPLNICEWEHVYRSSSAYAKLVSCFLSKQCYYTRYKVKIDESTTTSKFYNLFQYNFCKKNLWVGAGKKTAQPWKKGWLDQQQPLGSLTSDNNKLVVQLKWFFGLMPHYFRCGRLSSVLSIFWQLLSFELILASEIWSFSHSKYAICK